MNQESLKAQLFTLLSQLKAETTKVDGIVKEINAISEQIKGPLLNLDPEIEQLTTALDSMKTKIKANESSIKTNETNENENKINAQTNKVDIRGLKIHIGFKNSIGEVHTFEAQYGTTLDKLLTTYCKTLGMDPYNNFNHYFEYNGKNLNLGDYRKIEQIFGNAREPTILVKQYDNYATTQDVNQDDGNALYQEDNNYNFGF